ncbi:MAG: SDR family NAD(P)-dependent oxidoreductase [Rhodobacteraceae bacterium]|nr:SDR family NAD(P)-dependent oxidoreductase [Paracoccaceae bacterium]
MNIDGLSAIVTGGASGLGEATARMLAENGARVTIFDTNGALGKTVADQIGGDFRRVDVSDTGSVAAGLSGLEPRICINCAGIAPGAKTVDREGQPHAAEIFAKTVNINLIGTFNVATQSAALMATAPPLDEDGARGVIINTASIAAYEGQIGQIAYAASKGGVASMTLPMARDMARAGVRVMAIAPGLFLTPMLEGLPQEVQDSLGAQAPFPPRLGKPPEFAALVRHIIENRMLNGEVIRLDAAIRIPPK